MTDSNIIYVAEGIDVFEEGVWGGSQRSESMVLGVFRDREKALARAREATTFDERYVRAYNSDTGDPVGSERIPPETDS